MNKHRYTEIVVVSRSHSIEVFENYPGPHDTYVQHIILLRWHVCSSLLLRFARAKESKTKRMDTSLRVTARLTTMNRPR